MSKALRHSIDEVLDVWDKHYEQGRLVADVSTVTEMIQTSRAGRIQTVNLQHLYEACMDTEVLRALADADHVVADGWPLAAYTSRRFGVRVHRVTGRDLVHALSEGLATGRNVAVVGSTDRATSELREVLPRFGSCLVFADTGRVDDKAVRGYVENSSLGEADVILVALGAPRGEIISSALKTAFPTSTIVQIGGALDMRFGDGAAAPDVIGRAGLEWLFRLAAEPRRLGRRYILQCAPLVRPLAARAFRPAT